MFWGNLQSECKHVSLTFAKFKDSGSNQDPSCRMVVGSTKGLILYLDKTEFWN